MWLFQVTVKRALDQENQPRPKRTRGDYSKKSQTGESTESSEEEEEEEEDEGDSETGSQASGTSHASPGTPTSKWPPPPFSQLFMGLYVHVGFEIIIMCFLDSSINGSL